VIPAAEVTEWRAQAPWANDADVEQDLVTTEKPEPALSLDMPLAPFRNPFGAEEMLEAPFEARSFVAGFVHGG
jgi:hypothetical protein